MYEHSQHYLPVVLLYDGESIVINRVWLISSHFVHTLGLTVGWSCLDTLQCVGQDAWSGASVSSECCVSL